MTFTDNQLRDLCHALYLAVEYEGSIIDSYDPCKGDPGYAASISDHRQNIARFTKLIRKLVDENAKRLNLG